ncbi:hypothetical protein ACFLVX_00630 [Chloroflexota bacterium]
MGSFEIDDGTYYIRYHGSLDTRRAGFCGLCPSVLLYATVEACEISAEISFNNGGWRN